MKSASRWKKKFTTIKKQHWKIAKMKNKCITTTIIIVLALIFSLLTVCVSATPPPTYTPYPTYTPFPTNTPIPTNTPVPTNTVTPVPTATSLSTATLVPTSTLQPTSSVSLKDMLLTHDDLDTIAKYYGNGMITEDPDKGQNDIVIIDNFTEVFDANNINDGSITI